MKKLLLAASVCAVLGVSLFADDAKVLPAGVIRLTTAPTYAMINGTYDEDGKYEAYESKEGAIKAFNLGFALEYGVNDFISAAVQWAPGVNLWSERDMIIHPLFPDATANVNGLYDIFAGAKIQVVGTAAPVKSEQIRFAVAPGVKIPLPGADFIAQFDNLMDEKDVTVADPDLHALGLGARLYADYVVTPALFVNLYSEYIYFMERTDVLLGPTPEAAEDTSKGDVDYGYSLKVEFEPNYTMDLSDTTSLNLGLPVTYSMKPDRKVNGETVKDTASSDVAVKPGISLFLKGLMIPTEFKVSFSQPVYGTNTGAAQSVTFQIKNYLKF